MAGWLRRYICRTVDGIRRRSRLQKRCINAVRESFGDRDISDEDAGGIIWGQKQWKRIVFRSGMNGYIGLT